MVFLTACQSVEDAARMSAVARQGWERLSDSERVASPHGSAPIGYTVGLAETYAWAYANLKSGQPDPYVKLMVRPVVPSIRDGLHRLSEKLAAQGMTNDTERERLRNLFVILYELGVRESDGRYYLGLDTGIYKPGSERYDPTGLTTEAGLFQSSWNYSYDTPRLKELFAQYRDGARTGVPLSVFAEGVPAPKGEEGSNIGRGNALEFQKLVKIHPQFAVEFAALNLRNIGYGDYFFVRFRLMQISPQAENLFKEIERIVDRQ